jgi:hypothetical protein
VKLLRPGQIVALSEGRPGEPSTGIEGRISQITIYSDLSAQYKVVWWNDRTRNECWVSAADLVEPDDAIYLSIELEQATCDDSK